MRQTWEDLTFLHWPYDPAIVRRVVPNQLQLDLYDGRAWIGLVPFMVTGLTLPSAPAIPWLSRFPETNVRTYVLDSSGRRGVWFFSLDAARLLAVLGARVGFALPYFWARMRVARSGSAVRYASTRRGGPDARSDIEVRVDDAVAQPSELEMFLTARFRLFALRTGRVLGADVEHPPWALRRASLVGLKEDLVRAAGLPEPAGEPLSHFGGTVQVMVGAPTLR
jgi:uncharacterized protein YqjF (DUF2071 family)